MGVLSAEQRHASLASRAPSESVAVRQGDEGGGESGALPAGSVGRGALDGSVGADGGQVFPALDPGWLARAGAAAAASGDNAATTRARGLRVSVGSGEDATEAEEGSSEGGGGGGRVRGDVLADGSVVPLCLWAVGLRFEHPVTGQAVRVDIEPYVSELYESYVRRWRGGVADG